MYGMLGGQSVDVTNEGKPMGRQMLDYIYENKTSALIEASLMVGANSGRSHRGRERADGTDRQ